MIIKISSVANEFTISPLNNVYTALEDRLNVYMGDESFGPVSQFTIVIVAVHDDVIANYAYCRKNNKTGSFIHPFNKERISYLSIAVPYAPSKVLSLNDTSLREDLCDEIIRAIVKKEIKIPKGFDFDRFSEKIKLGLEKYKKHDL